MPSKDDEGRVYYYQVNGEASAWELPEVNYQMIDSNFNYSSVQKKCDKMWWYMYMFVGSSGIPFYLNVFIKP